MTNISTSNVYRDRMDFAKIHTSIPIPNLIEVQRKSYHRFLQMDVPPAEREDVGLQAVFNSVFPINDFRGTSKIIDGKDGIENSLKSDVLSLCRRDIHLQEAMVRFALNLDKVGNGNARVDFGKIHAVPIYVGSADI